MTNLHFTHHAVQRVQQRAISNDIISLVFNYGSVHYHKDRQVIFLDNDEIRFLSSEKSIDSRLLDKCKSIYLILENDTVITVARNTTKFRRDYWH